MSSTEDKVFEDLGLPDNTINQNYTWRQIKIAQNQLDNIIYDDPTQDILIVPNVNNDFNPAENELTQVGTNSNTTDSSKVVSVGHNLSTINSDTVINIGGDSDPTLQTIINSDATICIGFNNDIGNVDENDSGISTICIGNNNQIRTLDSGIGNPSDNIVIGNNSGLSSTGFRNISIGHIVENDRPGINNTIVISSGSLNIANKPVDNSVVFGGINNQPASNDARIQFLSSDLIPEGAGAGFPAAFDALIRINYRGTNYKIPAFLDP